MEEVRGSIPLSSTRSAIELHLAGHEAVQSSSCRSPLGRRARTPRQLERGLDVRLDLLGFEIGDARASCVGGLSLTDRALPGRYDPLVNSGQVEVQEGTAAVAVLAHCARRQAGERWDLED